MKKYIEEIVEMEWEMFSKINNIDGEAECQSNKAAFCFFRTCQFECWSNKMIESYFNDVRNAKRQGCNLVFEKYAYMMKKISPDEFSALGHILEEKSQEFKDIIEVIIKQHMLWMVEGLKEYEGKMQLGRKVYSSEDTKNEASYESYLRGELMTYSFNTLKLYSEYIDELVESGKNLNNMIFEKETNI